MSVVEAPPSPEAISYMIASAVKSWDARRPRSAQKNAGILGPSDLGFCRQKALLTMQQQPETDVANKGDWAAFVGTAVGERVEAALKDAFPHWIIGSIDHKRVTTTLSNGAIIGGVPDILVPAWNCVLDLKTKDGFGWVKREPWSRSYRFQTWVYAKAAAEMGLLDPTKPLYQGLIYMDRAGNEDKPYVVRQELDPLIEDELVTWVDDIIYANLHGEDASRDIPAPVCEKICEHFTACRGGLPDRDADLIDDPTMIRAAELYAEGLTLESDGRKLKKEAANALKGVSGYVGTWQVRWTHIPESFVPGYERKGYDRIDVRPSRAVRG